MAGTGDEEEEEGEEGPSSRQRVRELYWYPSSASERSGPRKCHFSPSGAVGEIDRRGQRVRLLFQFVEQ